MAEADPGKEGKDFHLDIPVRSRPFFLKGASAVDWGMQNRFAQIFNPDSGRTSGSTSTSSPSSPTATP
jgi:putative autoinducer-2 (AI-2) aldolase